MRSCSNSKISNNCFLLRIPVLEDFFPDRVLVVSATKAALVRVRRCGPWKLHIHHGERAPIYGLWIMRELEEHGHRLSPGTLYPLLSRVEGKEAEEGEGTTRVSDHAGRTPPDAQVPRRPRTA